MKVLSLFDGISCAQIALNRANINYTKYYASEIDKYAIKITQQNYPNTVQLGDINNVNPGDYDLIIGGSPCQGFSYAGKGLNFNDPRSKLFFNYVEILKKSQQIQKQKNKNLYFILENVLMKKEYQDRISDLLGISPILIDSQLVSAQSRKRLYWTNIPKITQPPDKKIFLKNIIEHRVVDRGKSYCIDANYHKAGNLKSYFEKHRRQLVFANAKALCVAERGRKLNQSGAKRDDKNGKIHRGYEVNLSQKSNTLTTVTKDNYIFESQIIRKLTPIECERLQTIPDNYTDCVSATQRYKALGNAFTVDVIAHILSFLPIN
jgi:site-specific DNA-cytosine methylase